MELKEQMYVAFDKSKSDLNISLFCSVSLLIFSSSQFFNYTKIEPVTATIVVFVLQGISFIYRNIFLPFNYSLGEKIRRFLMLRDGLGKKPSENDLAAILYDVGEFIVPNIKISSEYYESASEPGPKRLTEHVRESSFFSSRLSKTCSNVIFSITSIGFFSSLFSYFIFASDFPNEMRSPLAKALMLSLLFWVCGDLAALGIRYFRASSNLENIFSRASNLLKQNDISEQDSLIVFSDYNSTLASSPPIIQWVFDGKQSTLNKAWKGRKQIL